SIPDAAYRFCMYEPGCDVILSGTGSLEHLQANIASHDDPICPPTTDAAWRRSSPTSTTCRATETPPGRMPMNADQTSPAEAFVGRREMATYLVFQRTRYQHVVGRALKRLGMHGL
ncbi:MAG: hypothetical protein GX591_15190, partial [Planctomycetes bacterium]|nr:hypothetical protein [Planctomycetota bacterium]